MNKIKGSQSLLQAVILFAGAVIAFHLAVIIFMIIESPTRLLSVFLPFLTYPSSLNSYWMVVAIDVIILAVISFLVFRAKFPDLAKALYLVFLFSYSRLIVLFPLMVMFNQSNMRSYLEFIIETVIIAGLLIYYRFKKLAWTYYLATIAMLPILIYYAFLLVIQ